MSESLSILKERTGTGHESLDGYRRLRTVLLFDGIPNDYLKEIIRAGRIRLETADRDDVVQELGPGDSPAEVLVVVSGQVVVAEGTRPKAPETKARKAKKAAATPARAEAREKDEVGAQAEEPVEPAVREPVVREPAARKPVAASPGPERRTPKARDGTQRLEIPRGALVGEEEATGQHRPAAGARSAPDAPDLVRYDDADRTAFAKPSLLKKLSGIPDAPDVLTPEDADRTKLARPDLLSGIRNAPGMVVPEDADRTTFARPVRGRGPNLLGSDVNIQRPPPRAEEIARGAREANEEPATTARSLPESTADPGTEADRSRKSGVGLDAREPATREPPNEGASKKGGKAQKEKTGKKKRKAKKLRKEPPRIYQAKRHLAVLGRGEVITGGALDGVSANQGWVFAATPVKLARIDANVFGEMQKLYGFLAERTDRARRSQRDRVQALAQGDRHQAFDFFVRNGFSVATEIKVRQVDRCIECDACETACQDRYGWSRLDRHGTPLGLLDFTFNCRTCSDARCVDVCAGEYIKVDANLGQVVIDDACVGCNLCAKACPYGAIQMIERVDLPAGMPGALPPAADGEKPKKAKLKKIAIKCEHCHGYDDMACISACPTGSLISIDPKEVFRGDGELRAQLASTGYEETVAIDLSYFEAKVFQSGLPDDKTLRRSRQQFTAMLAVFGLLTLGFLFESITRSFDELKTFSVAYVLDPPAASADFIEVAAALEEINYRPGGGLGRILAYCGLLMLIAAGLYPAFRRSGRSGSGSRTLMNLHVVFGLIGPAWVAIHTAMRLDTWVSVGVWAMLLVVVSGIVGRYLYGQIPAKQGERDADERASRQEAEQLTLDLGSMEGVDRKALGDLMLLDAADADAGNDKRQDEKPALRKWRKTGTRGALAQLRWLLVDDLRRLRRHRSDQRRVLAGVSDRPKRREAERTFKRLRKLQRRKAHLAAAEQALGLWKMIHVPGTVVLGLVAVVHVIISWSSTGFP